jgi:hypothetical protein
MPVSKAIGIQGDFVKLGSGEEVFVPDTKIEICRPEYVLHPAHGHVTFMVEDITGQFIGWMPPEVIGYESVLAWMKDKKYVGGCKCLACLGLSQAPQR